MTYYFERVPCQGEFQDGSNRKAPGQPNIRETASLEGLVWIPLDGFPVHFLEGTHGAWTHASGNR